MRTTYMVVLWTLGHLVLVVSSLAAGLRPRAASATRPRSTLINHVPTSAILSPRAAEDARPSYVIYRYNSTTTPASSASSASPTPTSKPSDPPKKTKWTFNIESGNQGVQVGSWTPDVTHDDLLRALRDRCSKNPKKWGQSRCSSQDYGFFVEYANKYGKQTEYKNAAKIHVASDFIPESYGIALQDAFMEQIADVYKFAIEEDKNCYTFDPKSTICTFCIEKLCTAKYGPMGGKNVNEKQRMRRWCNVPDYVRVAISDQDGKEQAHMRAELRFDCPIYMGSSGCKTGLGKHDCVASLEKISSKVRGDKTKNELFGKVTQGKEFNVAAKCSSKEVTGSCPNKECLYQLGGCFR